MNIQQAFSECLADIESNHPHTTYRAYRNALNKIREYLTSIGLKDETPLAELKVQHMVDYHSWLARKRYAKSSLVVYLVAVKHLLDWLIEKGLIETSAADTLRMQKAGTRVRARRQDRLPRVPAKGAEDKVLAVARQLPLVRDQAIFEFLYSSGCRRAEVCGLKVEDLDLDDGSAMVTGKGDKQRRVYFSTRAGELLRAWLAECDNPGGPAPVFVRLRKGGRLEKVPKPLTTGAIGQLIDRVTALAGLDKSAFTAHSFRHAFAIRVLRETKDLSLVQDLLGHASPNSTRVYATIYPDEMRDAHRQVFG